jgi:hypothetical protein
VTCAFDDAWTCLESGDGHPSPAKSEVMNEQMKLRLFIPAGRLTASRLADGTWGK